ncbi:MAG: glycoside hydrolase family 73 protein [Terriglobales bacterium]
MTKHEFITAAAEAALASSRMSSLPPGVTVAQAALESAWGRSQLARDAHNYFGIKAHGSHRLIELPTTEVVNGKAVRTSANFAAYDSMAACFADRDQLILKLACYADARACSAGPLAFIRALSRHWATDPEYAQKLIAVYTRNRLDRLDRVIGRSGDRVIS